MEATIYKSTNKKMKKVALPTLLEGMRIEQKQIPVTTFREMLNYCMPESHPTDAEKLPVTVFSGVYNRSSGNPALKQYNGIILVEKQACQPYRSGENTGKSNRNPPNFGGLYRFER